MQITENQPCLTDAAVMAMVQAGVQKAMEMGQPQCIVIVDTSAVDLAVVRMRGARVLSLASARAKARTVASTGQPSASLPKGVGLAIGLATDGAMTGLPGGLPIRVGGALVGGIGVGSGSGDQDIAVAAAALAAIGADPVS